MLNDLPPLQMEVYLDCIKLNVSNMAKFEVA